MNTQQILGNSCIWGERLGNGTGQGNLNLRDLLLFLIFNPKQTEYFNYIFFLGVERLLLYHSVQI